MPFINGITKKWHKTNEKQAWKSGRETPAFSHIPVLCAVQGLWQIQESVATCKSFCGESQQNNKKKSQVTLKTSVSEEDFPKQSSTSVSKAPSLQQFQPSSTLVVVELKMEATARLERVKVEGPGLLSTATTLLVFRVQWILARVEFLPHFWREIRSIRFCKAKDSAWIIACSDTHLKSKCIVNHQKRAEVILKSVFLF